MTELAPKQILYPAFALFFLTCLVFLRLRSLRFAAVRSQTVSATYYRAFQGGSEPEQIQVVTRNFINLFEVPVLFYVIVIMIYVTQQVSLWLVVCSWVYVALRYAHTFVHLGANDVIRRFTIYFASGVVLALMWGTLLVKLLLGG